MPRFTVQDDSGNTLTLEGDSPPTEQELEDIFAQHSNPQRETPEIRGPEAAFIPDIRDTTRGGEKVATGEFGVTLSDVAEGIGQNMPGPAAFNYWGGIARAIPADIAAGVSLLKRKDDKTGIIETIRQNLPAAAEASGNIPEALLNQAQLPVDLQLEAAANEPGGMGPAVLGYTSQGLAATAPLLGIGALPSWMAKLASAGFSVHMMTSAPKLFEEYANEINKPEDEQDKALIANLQSQIIQTFAFAPAAGKHGASGVAKEIGTAFENASRFSQTGERKSYASQIPETATLHGDVRPQAGQAEQLRTQVPAEESGARVQSEAEGRVLSPEEQNPSRTPLYRGTTLEQWNQIKSGQQPQSEFTTGGNTWATTKLESAQGYTRETGKNAVIIEYKDSAHDKVKRLTDDPGDHRRQGPLTLEDVQRVTDGDGNVIYEASKEGPAKTGRLTPEEQAHFKELNNKFFGGEEMSADEIAALDSYDARNKTAMQQRVERQAVPDEPAQAEFEAVAKKHGYNGEVAFVDEKSMADGDVLKSSWAIWNPKSGRIEVNRDAWNSLTPERRAKLVESVASEEAIHSKVSDADAMDYLNNSTGIQRAIGRRIYTAGTDAKVSDAQLGHEMLRRTIQHLRGVKPTELVELAGREGWTVKSLDAVDRTINKVRQAVGTKASKAQLATLDKVQENIGIVKSALQSGAVSAPQRQQEPGDAAKKFLDELNKSGADFRLKNASNDPSVPTTQKLGMQLNSIADLDALLKVNNQIKSTLADVKSGKVKMTPDLFEKALRVQFPREMIETATNSGSWAEGNATGRPGGEVLGKRPLDWRSNPEVEAWLREHGKEIGIELPAQSEVAAAPQRYYSKEDMESQGVAVDKSAYDVDVKNELRAKLVRKNDTGAILGEIEDIVSELPDSDRKFLLREYDSVMDEPRHLARIFVNINESMIRGEELSPSERTYHRIFKDYSQDLIAWGALLMRNKGLGRESTEARLANAFHEDIRELNLVDEFRPNNPVHPLRVIQEWEKYRPQVWRENPELASLIDENLYRKFEHERMDIPEDEFESNPDIEFTEMRQRLSPDEIFDKDLNAYYAEHGGPPVTRKPYKSRQPDRAGPNFKLSAPRRGLTKKEQQHIEDLRKYREAMGKQGKTESFIKGEPAVPPEERVSAEAAGALPRLNAFEIEQKADEFIAGKIEQRKQSSERMGFDQFANWVRKKFPKAQNEAIAQKQNAKIKELYNNPQVVAKFSQAKSNKSSYDRPKFSDFKEWVKNNVAQVESSQIRQMWEDAVWSELVRATPERLDQWRSALGLDTKYGKSVIAPAQSVAERAEAERLPGATTAAEANEVAKDYNHQARLRRAQDLRGIEAAQRYRNKVISAIAQKLIGESLEGRAELNRSEITIDDIDFANKKTKTGVYSVIRESDLGNPEVLNRLLRDQARASSNDPESASRRLVAVVNRKTGSVELLSTYNDNGVQRVTDPAGARLTGKPSRELNKTFLRQYRPFASLLLADPVKAFRQKFESVAEFSDKIGEEASNRSRIGDFPGESEAPADFSVEGTPGIKGEGGMFQGPYRVPASRGGALESSAKLTSTEINNAVEVLSQEAGSLETADDIRVGLMGLADKAARGGLKAADWAAVNGLRKMFGVLEKREAFKNMSREELLDVLADKFYEKYSTKNYDTFVKETLAEFEGQGLEDVGPVAEGSKFSKELTMPVDRVPPTVVRPEQLPPYAKLPEPRGAPKAKLGASVPGEPYIHRVSNAEFNAKINAAHALGREYQANQDWGIAFGEKPKARRLELREIKMLQNRMRNKQGRSITEDQAKKILEIKKVTDALEFKARTRKGVYLTAFERMKAAEQEINKPLRTIPPEPAYQSEIMPAPMRGPREAIMPDTDSPVPRFVPNVSTALTRAMGIERIPLIGRLWGERAKIRDAADQDIIGYSVKRSIGNSQSAIIGAKMAAENERLGNPFQQDKDGRFTNVNIEPDRSQFPSDVFEAWQRESIVPEKMMASRKFTDSEIAEYSEKHPQTVYLNKNQEALFRKMLRVIEDGYKYLDEKNAKLETYNGESMETRRDQMRMYGLPKGIEWYPFPRLALYKRSVGPIATEIRRRIGGQYAIERDRLYKTEEQGQKTTAYEPDMTKRLATFVQRVYKSVADADLANSSSLKGETPEQRMTKLGKEYEAELRSGRMSQQDVIDLAYQPRLGIEGEVSHHPAFSGKIYPIEIANRLNKAFGEQSHRWVRSFAELSTASKAFMLTGDLAQYLQQGSLLMFRHPAMWANATKNSLKAIASGNVTGRILNNPENFKAATEFVQGGGSMGHLQDFMSGSQPGEMATRVPGFRQVVIRSGRAFGTFQDIAKLEMWKALRTVTPKEQWPEVIESIENMVLSGRMESAGMNHARATGERLMLMASAYYRGAFNLVAGAAEGGVAGSEARKALASYAAGITALMVGSYLLAGMSWEEIRHRLTPGQNNRKFLKFPVKMGEDTVEVGPGGIMLSLLNLGTDMATTTATDPKAMVSFGEKNPMIKWLTTRLGPIPSLGRKLATGEDAFGRPTGPFESGVQTITPIPVQKGWQAAQSANKGAGVLSAGSSFLGLDSSRYRAASEIYDLAEKFMKNSGLKKDSGWDMQANDEASYTKLRSAISAGSQRKFNQIHEKMSESRTDRDMIAAMKKWRDSPFTGSEKAEREFRSTLTDYQQDIYELAQEERARVFDAFLDMISNVP